ncbi:AAA family ATPase [Shewanella sp. Scap07]|uniref:AAA family ATPase n=1 Tax=Shewanella sp. Scap07 TaxID=2589987 RepID=UPI0015BD039D|nr:AAA family ATPase [Shewanella sp. Scap07]QLE85412.1 AAA family ATPase [Shewanella sp. Scap07]
MKLIFAHVVDHKVLQNISIPFSSQFIVTYKHEVLTIKDNPDYLPEYYDGVDITAIIGVNGSGKTSILEFIEQSFGYTESSGFIVWFNEKERAFEIQDVNFDKSFGFDDGSPTYNVKVKSCFNCRKKENFRSSELKLLKIDNISKTHINNEQQKNKNSRIVKEVSANYKTTSNQKSKYLTDLIEYLNSEYWDNNNSKKVSYAISIKHTTLQFNKTIQSSLMLFYRVLYQPLMYNKGEVKHTFLSTRLTENLSKLKSLFPYVDLENEDNNHYLLSRTEIGNITNRSVGRNNDFNSILTDKINNLTRNASNDFKAILEGKNSDSSKSILENQHLCLIIKSINYVLKSAFENNTTSYIFNAILVISFLTENYGNRYPINHEIDKVKEFIELTLKKTESFWEESDYDFDGQDMTYESNVISNYLETGELELDSTLNFCESLYFILEQINEENIILTNKGEIEAYLDNGDNIQKINILKDELPSYLKSTIDLRWIGLSSGQFALANIFSSIYNNFIISDRKPFAGADDFAQSISPRYHLIFIDEADLYLHPEWQRVFVARLIEMLDKMKVSNRIQIVITSHSPLIIGDFLPENIISLEVDDNKSSLLEAHGFGTEITDTLLNGMQLDSTYGELARTKLSELIEIRKANGIFSEDQKKLIHKIKNESLRSALLSGSTSHTGEAHD